MLESPFSEVTRLMACNFIKKETPTQGFSCEYHKMFDKRTPVVAPSGTPMMATSENGWRISKYFKRWSYMEWFVWFDQSESVNHEIMATICIKICMIRFLKDQMSSINSHLYEELLKPINCSMKDHLYSTQERFVRRIYKRERFAKMFCSNWRYEIK